MLGTAGGLLLAAGTGGLLYLKARMDRQPAAPEGFGMDIAFGVLLGLTALSGLCLLALRSTALMGSLLVVHVGFVAGLFVTLPYGKFLHGVYRYAALLRNAIEQRDQRKGKAHG
jgi:citrate/tricarballylate utilization protein